MSGTTGNTGGGQPFENSQPSLAVIEVTPTEGIFPSTGPGGSATGDTLGFVYDFAGNFAPGTSFLLQGQSLSISSNQILFALFGTTYGGNGTTNFTLPNEQGIATIGIGTGVGLPQAVLGVETGSATTTLLTSQLPPHDHTVPGGGVTGNTGGGLPFDNTQPSLPLEALIATAGVFPSNGGSSGSAAFIGQVAEFAGNFVPSGWAAADGRLLSISSNTALFSILGTAYGGDGINTFALPDLRGRVAAGADAADPLGTSFGQAATTLTVAQLPPHEHSLPGGGTTGVTGGGQPVTNDQPSLALNYIIATSGIFPQNGSGAGFNSDFPIVGQISEFAGNFAPSGWAFANGQTLAINTNVALFSILGVQYGGNGTTTFALPDLRGRTLVGTGSNNGSTYVVGQAFGTDATTLTVANLPAHDHTLSCFAAGTRIATERGDVPVEQLREGDLVRLAGGDGVEPIMWIGQRTVNCDEHPRPGRVLPVRIAAGAFGSGQPTHELWLSPDHAVFAEGVLIPVKYLINGSSIAQVQVSTITYYHVELPQHSVLLAEGLAVESLLPGGDRGAFENNGGAVQLHPDFHSLARETFGYAPLVVTGAALETVRERLREQAITVADKWDRAA